MWIIRGERAQTAIAVGKETGVDSRLATLQTDSEMGAAGLTRTAGEVFSSLLEQGCAYLPALQVTEPEEGTGETVLLEAGYGILRDGKLVGYLEGEGAKGLELLTGQTAEDILEIELPSGQAVARVTDSVLRCEPVFQGDELVRIRLNCRVITELAEFHTPMEQSELKQLKKALEERESLRLQRVMDQLRSWGTDCAGLGSQIAQANPARWEAIGAEWERLFTHDSHGNLGPGDLEPDLWRLGVRQSCPAAEKKEEERVEQDRISQTQLCALLWAGLMAPAAELLPAVTLPAAGRGAWLSAAAVLPVLLIFGWGLGKMGMRPGGLAGTIQQGLGPMLGRLVLLLYLVWGELLLALRLRLCAQRLIASGERDGSLWFFLPTAALLVLWMARGKLAAFARAGQVFLTVLLVAAGIVLGLSLFQSQGEHLLPLWWSDILPILRSAIPLLGMLGYGVFAGFLLGDTTPSRRAGRDWVVWAVVGCLLLGGGTGGGHRKSGSPTGSADEQPFLCPGKERGGERGLPARGEYHRGPVDFCRPGVIRGVDLCPMEDSRTGISKGKAEAHCHCRPNSRRGTGDCRLPRGGPWQTRLGGRLRFWAMSLWEC